MKHKINSVITYLMPLCLMSSGFVNLILFYFGLHAYDDIRRSVSIVILSIFFVLSLTKLLFLYQDYQEERKKIITLCCIPALWILAFLVAMFKFGIQYEIVFTLGTFGIYCIPAFIFAISITIERTEVMFIKCFKWYALLIAPLMLFYIIRMIITPEFVYGLNNLGALPYLTIGYTLMHILVFCMLDLFLHKEENKWLKIVLVLILWTACIFSGAKGPLVCMLVFLVLFAIYLLFHKQKDKDVFWLSTAMTFILVFSVVIYSPPSSGLWRINLFINDLINKNIQSASMEEKYKALIFDLAQTTSPTKSIKKVLNETTGKPQVEPIAESDDTIQHEPNDTEGKQPISLLEVNWDRMFIFKMVITEGNNAPLTGLGPMGYTLKYGLYPHNIILELIADFGYLITAVFFIIILVLIIAIYKQGKHDKVVVVMLLFILSSIPKEMLSGTIYNSISLIFALGYACALLKNNWKKHVINKL